ncbi:hypothetical protein PFICI_03659 [Pestalotiopsis fici W106-1]|uniref:Amidoligase enzyme n=1 Tax=Pestalotiopsis fici (strain W106-1 / CGMCC3.15140) TaxID=1229662 RepID=W3XI03_PESFW|nr:uncharacterized protein PFICI_03659 [Pestalotiopsis fici W106-1]ETS85634.1 hypothetical protein PFICI_03659 [Pestalotiopsis fici W106-1]
MTVHRIRKCNTNVHDRPSDLSVAVELKFLLPFIPYSERLALDTELPRHATRFNRMPKTLRSEDRSQVSRYGFSLISNIINGVPGQSALTSYDLKDLNIQERDCWSTHWIVKTSNSAAPAADHPHRDDWIWVPVEVVSPKMACKDSDTMQIIAAVVESMQEQCHIVTNYTCEVHVHVGRMDGYPFSLPTLKRCAILTWLAEPVLRQVKDPKSPNFEHVFTWSSAARRHSRLATNLKMGIAAQIPSTEDVKFLPPPIKNHVKDRNADLSMDLNAIRLIAGTTSHAQLGRLMSGEGKQYRRLGFNFSAFAGEDERACTNPKTVECRFLEGMIKTDIVLGWLQIICRLVEVSLDSGNDDECYSRAVLHLIASHEEPLDTHFGRLMRRLQLSEDVYSSVRALVDEVNM